MKLFVVVLVILSAVAVFADDDDDWLQFKMKFGKLFLSPGKEAKRKQNFLEHNSNVNDLQAAYASGSILYEPAIYAFHDLAHDDLMSRITGLSPENLDDETKPKTVTPTRRQSLPTNYDSLKYLQGPRDQKQCGSCWTFSTMVALEAAYAMKYGSTIDLAEQQLVDCGKGGASGCDGGWMPSALNYLKKAGGAVEEYLYPYQAVFGNCQSKPTRVTVGGCIQIDDDSDSIKAAVMQYGALPIAVDASQWSYYKKGIFSATGVGQINHAVALVGWGVCPNTNQDYWLIRNSWGPNWGEQGYIRVATDVSGTYQTQYTYAAQLGY